MMSKKTIKIICIILAVLMALSTLAVILQIVAVDETAAVIPATGESRWPYILAAAGIGAAVIAILCVVLIPRKRAEKDENK